MPPPSGPVGRKATPGRGGRRGQATTPRPRKPRASNKVNLAGEKATYPDANDVAAYQQQIILQHQQQQQSAKLVVPKSPGQTQFEPATNSFQNSVVNAAATAPKVVVVSSAPSTLGANVAAKPTQSMASMMSTATQIMRQQPSTETTITNQTPVSTAATPLRLPNIPQVRETSKLVNPFKNLVDFHEYILHIQATKLG